jgi:hypothetical protein
MGLHRAQKASALIALLFASPTLGQTPGWQYSPLSGEGDRATLGCSLKSTSHSYVCMAVRCEDDFSTGVYVHTNRPIRDVGGWHVTIDKETKFYPSEVDEIYSARLVGQLDWVLDYLAQGAVAYLQPEDGSPLPDNQISLQGSLYAITSALSFCAPRRPL